MSERKTKMRYDYKLLQTYCEEHSIILRKDYSKEKVNRETIILAKCLNNDCNDVCSKTFRGFISFGCYCDKCSQYNRIKKTRGADWGGTIIRLNNKYLISFCLLNSIELIRDYSKIRVNRDTIISAKCLNEHCHEKFEKRFAAIVEDGGPYCSRCTQYNRIKKTQGADWDGNVIRFNINYLTSFCLANSIELIDDYTNIQVNRETIISAKCLTEHCNENFEKTFRGIVEHGGPYCEKCTQNTRILKMQIAEWDSDKTRFNNKYLNEFCLANSIELIDDYTNIQVNRETIISAKCLTEHCNENFEKTFRGIVEDGGPYCEKCTSNNVKEKFKATNMERYGCEYPLQNAEISEKASKNAYKAYEYTFPSGRIEKIQGTEKYMLNDLLQKENISEDDIIVSRCDVPCVWYEDETGNRHRYFVDCFIKSQNRCIEAKSTWTADKKQDCIYLKQQALKSAGYLCEIWIYDGKGEIVEKIV